MSELDFYSRLQDSKNVLLMRDDVGRAKPSIHNLPPEDFRYGKAEAKDTEGVYQGRIQAVTHHWAEHRASSILSPGTDYKRLNVLSVEKSLFRPKDVSAFRKEVDVRLQPRRWRLPDIQKPSQNLRFGVPSPPSDSMKEIMTNGYGNAAEVAMRANYQRIFSAQRTSPRRTASVTPHRPSKSQRPTPLFKMKKFLRVTARTQSHRD